MMGYCNDQLTELPIWIASMRNLKLLDVSDNAIKTLPERQGFEARHLAQVQEDLS